MKFLIALIFAFTSSIAMAQLNVGATLEGTADDEAALALAANAKRKYLLIQNVGENPVLVKFGSTIADTEGITIPAGGNYEPVIAPVNSIYIKATTGESDYVIVWGK